MAFSNAPVKNTGSIKALHLIGAIRISLGHMWYCRSVDAAMPTGIICLLIPFYYTH